MYSMIEKLKKQIADLEKSLTDKKAELREAIKVEEIEKLKPFLHGCCRIKSHTSITYLINISWIDIDDYDSDYINIEAEKVIIIETDLPEINLDENFFMFNPGTDVIESMPEERIWEVIGKDIKECLG